MFHTAIATTAVFFLAVTVYPADSQQRCTMLPIVYPVTEFDMQTCPTEDDIAGTIADITVYSEIKSAQHWKEHSLAKT